MLDKEKLHSKFKRALTTLQEVSDLFKSKIEHFDDMIQDNANQGSWAGLDAYLIDEEFLYLEDDEADRIYKELK